MIYDTTNPLQRCQLIDKVKYYIAKGKEVELKVKHPKRSISQNSYLHLLFEWFAVETGYTAEEVKQDIFKKIVNTSLFYDGEAEGKLKGVNIERWRSTASLSTAEMTLAIERFRNYASIEAGIYLPEPEDLVMIKELEREVSKHKNQEFV
jgi:hypothetical protein